MRYIYNDSTRPIERGPRASPCYSDSSIAFIIITTCIMVITAIAAGIFFLSSLFMTRACFPCILFGCYLGTYIRPTLRAGVLSLWPNDRSVMAGPARGSSYALVLSLFFLVVFLLVFFCFFFVFF